MKFEWLASAEKCGQFWKVGVQTENGSVYFSKRFYVTQEDALKVAKQIQQAEEFVTNEFEYDFSN